MKRYDKERVKVKQLLMLMLLMMMMLWDGGMAKSKAEKVLCLSLLGVYVH
jgi:hypothetical protein